MMRTFILCLMISGLFLAATGWAASPSLPLNAPFASVDQNPWVRIYGLPRPTAAQLPPDDTAVLNSTLDIASLYVLQTEAEESLTLDGEVWRLTLAGLRSYGNYALGIEVPLIYHSGGIFDSTINEFHRVTNLSTGNRKFAEENKLLYQYQPEHNQTVTLLEDNQFGIGDIALIAGYQLPSPAFLTTPTTSLWAQLELPTGSVNSLTGSKSVDVSSWCSLALPVGRRFTVYGTAGGLIKSQGELLPEQEERLVGFSSLGAAWQWSDALAVKLQGDFHTRFFNRSHINTMGDGSAQVIAGLSWNMNKKSRLDLAFSEDVYIHSAPDIALHIAYSRQMDF